MRMVTWRQSQPLRLKFLQRKQLWHIPAFLRFVVFVWQQLRYQRRHHPET